MNFEYEADYVAPTWPSVAGQQQTQTHLDIAVADLAASTAWAVEVGATLAEFQPQEDVRVLLDPVGHPFCLFTAPDAWLWSSVPSCGRKLVVKGGAGLPGEDVA